MSWLYEKTWIDDLLGKMMIVCAIVGICLIVFYICYGIIWLVKHVRIV